jgi:hypothetical protein
VGGCAPGRGCATTAPELLSTILKDADSPFIHEIQVPMDEISSFSTTSPNIKYMFKSSKKPVHFEITYRSWGSDDEVSIVAPKLYNSHNEDIFGSVPSAPGIYNLSWSKPSKGLFSMSSIGLEYFADLELLDKPSEEKNVENIFNDDDDFVDCL